VAAGHFIKLIGSKLTRIVDRLTAVWLRHFDFSTLQRRYYPKTGRSTI
jgi:hypothetical protein